MKKKMGYMRHHAIIVTSWNEKSLATAHVKAQEFFSQVAPITPETINGYVSFLVAPDGSKEGWGHSDDGNVARSQFISWLDSQRYDDDSTSLQWAEVQFGDDGGETKIISHSDEQSNNKASHVNA